MILTFDGAIYSKLLAEIAPRAIETQEEYDRLLAVAERLTFAKNLTPEEKVLYKLLVTLIIRSTNRSLMRFCNTSWNPAAPVKRTW
jgi:hypothetical protein